MLLHGDAGDANPLGSTVNQPKSHANPESATSNVTRHHDSRKDKASIGYPWNATLLDIFPQDSGGDTEYQNKGLEKQFFRP